MLQYKSKTNKKKHLKIFFHFIFTDLLHITEDWAMKAEEKIHKKFPKVKNSDYFFFTPIKTKYYLVLLVPH